MTDLDTGVPHLVTAPHLIPNTGTWFGWCSCGAEFMAGTADEVRAAGQPHRDAEKARQPLMVDRERDEARRLRREARREQRRTRATTKPKERT